MSASKRVLIVDDHDSMREGLELLLRRRGHRTLSASGGKEGLRLLHDEGADLVITGEGQLDAGSFDGKVVGGVLEIAAETGVPVGVVVGAREPGADPAHWRPPAGEPPPTGLVVLTERYGAERSLGDTLNAVREAAAELAAHLS